MATVDFNKPVVTDHRTSVLASVRDHVAAMARMFDGDTLVNTPTGTLRFNPTSQLIERWGGSSWSILSTNYARLDVGNTFLGEQFINKSTSGGVGLEVLNPAATSSSNVISGYFRTNTSGFLEFIVRNQNASGSVSISAQGRNAGLISELGVNSSGGYGVVGTTTSHPFHISTGSVSRVTVSTTGDVTFAGNITTSGTISGNGSGLTSLNASNITSGTFSGNGSGLTSLNASNISSGTLADARLSSNVALRNVDNNFSATQTITGLLRVEGVNATIGRDVSGQGGNVRLVRDTGETRWLAGILGTAGASSYTLYDLVRSATVLEATTNGNVTISAPASGHAANVTCGSLFNPNTNTSVALRLYGNFGGGLVFDDGLPWGVWAQGFGTELHIGNSSGSGFASRVVLFTNLMTVNNRALTTPASVSFSSTPTFDSTLSNTIYFGTMTGNVTSMTISNPVDGAQLQIRFVQDGTGGRTVTLPSSVQVSGSLDTGANRVTWLVLTYVASASRWEGTWTRIN